MVEKYSSGDRELCGRVLHWTANCVSEDGTPFTKYKLARLMGDILGQPTNHITPAPEAPAGAPRPRDCHLDRSALEAHGIGRETDLRAALKATLDGALGGGASDA